MTPAFVALTDFQLLQATGVATSSATSSLTAVANLYMSLYGRLRVDIKAEKCEIAAVQEQIANSNDEPADP